MSAHQRQINKVRRGGGYGGWGEERGVKCEMGEKW